MYKSCSICGKIHDTNKQCKSIKEYRGGEERQLRNLSKWHKKSLEIRHRANYLCEVCRDQGEYTFNHLEVHHIEKLSENADLLLDNYNLIVLCQRHHKDADKGLIDKEYLKRLAEEREGK